MSYCQFVAGPGAETVHAPYHNFEYGFPSSDEVVLFERLVLEINQAGLSWETILKKREGFRAAYDGFDPEKVAAYGEEDRARLLADAGIIRNRLKVEAAIFNAGVIVGIGCMVIGMSQVWVAHLLLGSMFLSSMVKFALQIVFYRRGV